MAVRMWADRSSLPMKWSHGRLRRSASGVLVVPAALYARWVIDAIVSGEHELIEFVLPEPETPTVFPVDRGDGDRTQEIEPGEAAGGSERDRASATTWTILGGTAIVLLAVLAWWLLTRPAADTPPMSLSSEENVTGTDILADFLARNVWLPASVNAFRAAWDEVDPLARERLRASPSMDRLNDGILRQINSENALIELGDGRDALEAQAMLLELARHVGLDNARLRRAREDWEAAVATATPDVGDTAGATAAGGESPVLRASPDAIRDDADATSGDDPAASTAERNPPADTTAEAAIDTSGTGGNARPQPKRSDATDAEKTRPTPKTAPVASTVAVPTGAATA